jgi:hypothetical protein
MHTNHEKSVCLSFIVGLECGIFILAGTVQAKQQEKRRVVEKHVTHKEEQQTSKMVLTYN